MITFDLFSIDGAVGATADEDGIRIQAKSAAIDIFQKETWPAKVIDQPGAWKCAIQIERLLESGLASRDETGFCLPYSRVSEAAELESDLTASWIPHSRFGLKIDRHSDLGRPDFRYRYQFIEDGRSVLCERLGCFVRRVASQEVSRLNDQMYVLLDAMDSFNQLPIEERTQERAWLTFAHVKGCAKEVAASLDSTLSKVDVVIPSRLELDIREDGDAVTFLPKCPEMGPEEFQNTFDRNDEVAGFYSVDRPNQGKIRVVLSDVQKEVLTRMKRVRRVSGPQGQSLRENPSQVFDGVLDAVELPYSDRVIGVGDFRFTPIPRTQNRESEMSKVLHQQPDLPGMSIEQSVTSVDNAPEASRSDSGDFKGSSTSVPTPPGTAETPSSSLPAEPLEAPAGKKYLLIETHEQSVPENLTTRGSQLTAASLHFQRPRSLRGELVLHPHQQAGIQWMQTCQSIDDRAGILLADDMGLGKTLQILTFLAWAIETKAFPDVAADKGPYRPILVVVPLILLENTTWEQEMRTFFEQDGSIFLPTLSLHGKNIERIRRPYRGGETDIGRPLLDLDAIQRNRVVFTNYETIRNYQHSFAYMRNGKSLWSAVITDEAQEYKVPNSKISHAVKALTADFRIGSTGTPVENRLLDLWNIMDALQPGLLKSAREFTSSYESARDDAGQELALRTLKAELFFQRPHAFLLRRDKSQVATLPKKHTEKLHCEMSGAEIGRHMDLLVQLQRLDNPSKFLTVLQKFARLYQHPALLDGEGDDLSVDELVAQSSKLRRVVDELRHIRANREKVLIFARHISVQSILAKVFQTEFRIPVRIINGETKRFQGSGGGSNRRAILDEFKARPGFNVLILSPFVAGIGLTITEANHVIHYGRWWNPAVESQATDRVYRIGQNKDVTVYLPILSDPTGRIPSTFDERLDALMERKYSLAQDFLRPLPLEDELSGELHRDLMDEAKVAH
jgi:superfamily II DNA or RNA helicase